MTDNPLRKTPSGGPRLGMWIKIPALEIVELTAHAGYDFVVIDLEHGPMTLESCYQAIVVAQGRGLSALVRVPDPGGGLHQRLLDMGADGLLIPHVTSPERADALVRSMRFPPHGTRGLGTTSRAGVWGMEPTADYLEHARTKVLRVPQIEDIEAVDRAEAICSVDGVNAVLVGAGDLSLAMGVSPGDPAMTAPVDRVLAAAHAHDIPCGTAVRTAEAAAQAAHRGFDFVLAGNDATIFGTAARSLVQSTRDLIAAL